MGCDVCVRFALIVLGQASLSFSFFLLLFFFLLQVWERLDQDEAPLVPHKRIGVNTCERRLLQLPRRSLWIPSYSRCYLSADRCQSNSRARLPAPLWMRRTTPVELWVASNDPVAPKAKRTGEEKRPLGDLKTQSRDAEREKKNPSITP